MSSKTQCSRDEACHLCDCWGCLSLLLGCGWWGLGPSLDLSVQRFILILQLKTPCTLPGAGFWLPARNTLRQHESKEEVGTRLQNKGQAQLHLAKDTHTHTHTHTNTRACDAGVQFWVTPFLISHAWSAHHTFSVISVSSTWSPPQAACGV